MAPVTESHADNLCAKRSMNDCATTNRREVPYAKTGTRSRTADTNSLTEKATWPNHSGKGPLFHNGRSFATTGTVLNAPNPALAANLRSTRLVAKAALPEPRAE